MQGIETLHEKESTSVNSVLFRWRDMNFSLVEILESGGKRYLFASMDGVTSAERITAKTTGNWTISPVAEPKPAAGASTISSGSAPSATGPNTTGSQD